MKILSVYQSLPSSVSIFKENKIIAAAQEERFTRIKNDEEFPRYSIDYCLKEAGLQPKDLDAVALASFISPFEDQLVRKSQWNISDYIKEQHFRWKPYLIDKVDDKPKSLLDVFPDKVDVNRYPSEFWKDIYNQKDSKKSYLQKRSDLFADYLQISKDKIFKIDHHRAHAYYSYYASPFRKEPILALTIDGWGDGMNATVGIFNSDGSYKRYYKTDKCAIARIYRYMTLLLGMKPNEHEYKLMGLAPYGKAKYGEDALNIFRETLYVEGIEFKWNVKPTDSYFWFKERLEGIRFDNIAWGLQSWVEEILQKWVSNCIEEFKINKIVMAGGVAMNIKALGSLSSINTLENMFVGGSAGDESLAIGSGICLAEDLNRSQGKNWLSSEILSLPHLNLGPTANNIKLDQLFKNLDLKQFKIHQGNDHDYIVELLIQGLILARCKGRMEFGQRALGNRSIIADPINLEIKDRINSAIKNRDFWMPFAPVIIDTYVEKYIINPKGIESPHMTIGFETTPEGYSAMKAACHPSDKSVRPQILKSDANPDLYNIITAFARKTDRGALLNTSFNLHGHPIVNTPNEAIEVFTNSAIDGLILNGLVITKIDKDIY